MTASTLPVHQLPKYSIGDKVCYGRSKKLCCFVMSLTASIFADHTRYSYDLVEQIQGENYQDLEQDYFFHYPIIQAEEDELITIPDCNC